MPKFRTGTAVAIEDENKVENGILDIDATIFAKRV